MQMLSTGDIVELTGIEPIMLHHWCRRGILGGVAGGHGPGNHRQFGFMQALAVAVGAKYRKEGATLDRAVGVVQFLSRMPLERLEAAIDEGRTFPVPAAMLGTSVIPGVMIEPPADLDKGAAALMKKIDLPTIMAETKRKIEQLKKRPSDGAHRGRKRGLSIR